MLRHNASTGGTDLLAHFLAKYLPLNVGVIILLMDAVIIGFGGILLSGSTFMYSVLTIVAGGFTTGMFTQKRWFKRDGLNKQTSLSSRILIGLSVPYSILSLRLSFLKGVDICACLFCYQIEVTALQCVLGQIRSDPDRKRAGLDPFMQIVQIYASGWHDVGLRERTLPEME